MFESIDTADPTLQNLRPYSGDVVEVTVVSAGEPFWDSPTGKRPTPSEKIGEGNEFYILTPYTVTVVSTVSGNRPSGQTTVLVEGGQIGCDRLTVEPAVTLTAKASYVLFLKSTLPGGQTDASSRPLAFEAFPVAADGAVVTPLDGTMSMSALAAGLAPQVQPSGP